MELKIAYCYNQKFLPTNRHKKLRERQIKDTLKVNITELSSDIFPVAFIIHDLQSVQDGMTSYEDYKSEKCEYRMFAEEIRTYKGKLYIPIRITHGAAISTIFENESYIINYLERQCTKNCDMYKNDEFTEKSIVIKEDKEEVKQMLDNCSKSFIYFNGKFWRNCAEPIYNIETFGLGNNHGGTGFFIEYGYSNIMENNFNALQRDDAIDYGKAIAVGRGDTNSVNIIGKYSNIEVIMPEMVKMPFNVLERMENNG